MADVRSLVEIGTLTDTLFVKARYLCKGFVFEILYKIPQAKIILKQKTNFFLL